MSIVSRKRKVQSIIVIVLLFAALAVTQLSLAQAESTLVFGVDTSNNLVAFLSDNPQTLLGTFPITGIGSDQIIGIDFRPATGGLYALGVSGGTARIYIVDPYSGVASLVGTGGFASTGGDYGFDFNPTVDRIRVVDDAQGNLRLHPVTGALAATDSNITPASQITAAAYTDNFAGATRTTLYGIDVATDALVVQGGINGNPSPNGGVISSVGSLGVDTSSLAGFDISSDGMVLASLTVGETSGLYSINLNTGAATFINNIGGNNLRGIALATSRIAFVPSVPLCGNFDGSTSAVIRASIPDGTVSGGNAIYCRLLAENGSFVDNPAAIGNDTVLGLDIVQAVDIYVLPNSSPFNNGVRVCLLGRGDFMFLDASTSPRTPNLLASETDGAYTCAYVGGAGTVVLTNPQ